MGFFDKALDWGYKQGLKGIREKLQKAIKEKRLVFIGDNHVLYIDKKGKRAEHNFEQMVEVAIEAGGWQKNMESLAITHQDVVNILVEEYAKHKKEAK